MKISKNNSDTKLLCSDIEDCSSNDILKGCGINILDDEAKLMTTEVLTMQEEVKRLTHQN